MYCYKGTEIYYNTANEMKKTIISMLCILSTILGYAQTGSQEITTSQLVGKVWERVSPRSEHETVIMSFTERWMLRGKEDTFLLYHW